jgi:hypothetical protein
MIARVERLRGMKESVLLTIDGIINLLLGAALLAFPKGLVTIPGLPEPADPLYSGVLGGVLVGIGAGLVLQQLLDHPVQARGIEVPIVTNLGGAGALLALLVTGHLQIPLKGQIFLWVVAIIVLATGIAEIYFHFGKPRDRQSQVGGPLHS